MTDKSYGPTSVMAEAIPAQRLNSRNELDENL
jgi:hypothetical protein